MAARSSIGLQGHPELGYAAIKQAHRPPIFRALLSHRLRPPWRLSRKVFGRAREAVSYRHSVLARLERARNEDHPQAPGVASQAESPDGR